MTDRTPGSAPERAVTVSQVFKELTRLFPGPTGIKDSRASDLVRLLKQPIMNRQFHLFRDPLVAGIAGAIQAARGS